jgi:transporter family-2 protein
LAIIGYLFAIGAGVSFVVQQAVNSNLRAEIGSPWWAGFVSYLGGTIVMLLVAVTIKEPWLSKDAFERSHFVSWTGGIFGAIYIAISIMLFPRLGAAVVIALIVAGQMIGALACDHFGLLGIPVRAVTPPKVNRRGVTGCRRCLDSALGKKHPPIKFRPKRPFANPEAAVRKLLEIAHTAEAVQDGRIHIELINAPFIEAGGTPAESRAGLDRAIAKGWLCRHESGVYVKFAPAGALMFA